MRKYFAIIMGLVLIFTLMCFGMALSQWLFYDTYFEVVVVTGLILTILMTKAPVKYKMVAVTVNLPDGTTIMQNHIDLEPKQDEGAGD